jgi:hypothetical protein
MHTLLPRFLLCTVLFLTAAVNASADTWKVNGQTFSITIPKATNYRVTWKAFWQTDPHSNPLTGAWFTTGNGTTGTSPTSSNQVVGYNLPAMTQTSPFQVVIGYEDIGNGTPYPWYPQFWAVAYNYTGNPSGNGPGGTYNYNGEATTSGGAPVGPDGQPTGASGQRARVPVSNTGNSPQDFLITMRDGNGNVINQQRITLPPHSTQTLNLTNPSPFTYTVSSSRGSLSGDDGAVTFDPASTGSSTSTSEFTPTTPSVSGTITPTGTTAPNAQNNVARPGTTEGNADARNTELRGEVQRVATQVRTSGDVLHGDAVAMHNTANSIDAVLKGLRADLASDFTAGKGSTDALGPLISGVSEAVNQFKNAHVPQAHEDAQAIKEAIEAQNPQTQEDLTGWNSSTEIEEPNAPTNEAYYQAFANIPTTVQNIVSKAQALAHKLDSISFSKQSLNWTFSVMGYSINVDVNPYMSYIDAVRNMWLLLLTVLFVFAVIRVIRGAFADAN